MPSPTFPLPATTDMASYENFPPPTPPHPLFISNYLSLYPYSATYPALQRTLSSPSSLPPRPSQIRVYFHAGGFCFLKRPVWGRWKVISSCDLWRDLEEFETLSTTDRNSDQQYSPVAACETPAMAIHSCPSVLIVVLTIVVIAVHIDQSSAKRK